MSKWSTDEAPIGTIGIMGYDLPGGVGESNGGALTISKVAEDASIWCDMFHRSTWVLAGSIH